MTEAARILRDRRPCYGCRTTIFSSASRRVLCDECLPPTFTKRALVLLPPIVDARPIVVEPPEEPRPAPRAWPTVVVPEELELPAFDSKSRCVRLCGTELTEPYIWCCRRGNPNGLCQGVVGEHIHKRCPTCHYEWLEDIVHAH